MHSEQGTTEGLVNSLILRQIKRPYPRVIKRIQTMISAVKCIVPLLFLCACTATPSTTDTWKTLDLMPYGIPLSVQAPDSAEVHVVRVGAVEDVSIKNTGQTPYALQLFVQPALTNDIAALKFNQINEVKSNPFFGKIVEEDEQSFIYSLNNQDSSTYSFRYTHLQADKEYIFTTDFNQSFSLEEIKRLLQAVRQ